MTSHNIRFDIQFLRGIAVLAVVAFHAAGSLVPGGYLGVDVFFVLSGFLITGMLLRMAENGSIDFKGFYLRRARRLLPACLATLAGTTTAAVFVLLPDQVPDYSRQLASSVTFLANAYFAATTGYFDGASESKPLLHIWSLSLEEQFYFALPALLWLIPARRHAALLAGLFFLSLILYWTLSDGAPALGVDSELGAKLAFYMLPMRAWQLLAGGLAAWVMIKHRNLALPVSAKNTSIFFILACFALPERLMPDGLTPLVCTIATAIAVLGDGNWLPNGALTRAVSTIGDFSYSLYLVHWPLISLTHIGYMGDPPPAAIGAATLIAFPIAWAQYMALERPYMSMRGKSVELPVRALAGSSVFVLAAAFSLPFLVPGERGLLSPVYGLSRNCDQAPVDWQERPECSTGPEPSVLLWGDSFAEHLTPGLAAVLGPDVTLTQATMRGCPPIRSIAQTGGMYDEAWSNKCIAFNESVLSSIRNSSSIEYVILSSNFTSVFDDNGTPINIDGDLQPWRPAAESRLIETIRLVKEAGKVPIVVGPTPRAGFNIGVCAARELSGKLVFRSGGCSFTSYDSRKNSANIEGRLARLASEEGFHLLLPEDHMCDKGSCVAIVNGMPAYYDESHLSESGSIFLVKRLGLRELMLSNSHHQEADSSPPVYGVLNSNPSSSETLTHKEIQ